MRPLSTVALALCFVCSASAARAQTTWYVDVNGTPPGSGTQADPYTSVQNAIAQASTVAGDTVLVLPGTYFERIDFLGKDLVVQSQAGAAATILNGGASGTVVVFENGETQAALLEGFAIRNGRQNVFPNPIGGGGIRCDGASPRLSNLIVHNNAAYLGAGIYLNNSAATLSDSVIRDNISPNVQNNASRGTGLYSSCDSSPVVRRCEFLDNNHIGSGGGVFGGGEYYRCLFEGNVAPFGAGVYAACPTVLYDCILRANAAGAEGLAGHTGGARGATLVRCLVEDNFAGIEGAGVGFCELYDCVVRNNRASGIGSALPPYGGGAYDCDLYDCEIYGNTVFGDTGTILAGRGGGLYLGSATDCRIYDNRADKGRGAGAYSATLLRCEVFDNVALTTIPQLPSAAGGIADCDAERCIIYRNHATQAGGVLGGSLTHCVVYGNTADVSNGGLEVVGTTSVLNSILWGNDAPQIAMTSGSLAISYSDVEGGWPGPGNFSADPGLWAPMSGDVHLKSTSPCIDTGDPLSPNDPDGSTADVGVLPLERGYCGAPGTYCTAKGSLACIPSIGLTGIPGLTGDDDFFITASRVRSNNVGVLFFGSAPSSTPFFEGTLCVSGGVQRYGAMNSGGTGGGPNCSGTFSFHITQQRMTDLGFGSEETTYWQIIYRDPPQPDGTGVSLTDGLEVTFCP